MRHRRGDTLILGLGLLLGLIGAGWVSSSQIRDASWHAISRFWQGWIAGDWSVGVMRGAIGIAGIAVLMWLGWLGWRGWLGWLGWRGWRGWRGWVHRRAPMPDSGQTAHSFLRAASDETRMANQAILDRLAAQGITVPGFTPGTAPNHEHSILMFLAATPDGQASRTEVFHSTGIHGIPLLTTLLRLNRRGLVTGRLTSRIVRLTPAGRAEVHEAHESIIQQARMVPNEAEPFAPNGGASNDTRRVL